MRKLSGKSNQQIVVRLKQLKEIETDTMTESLVHLEEVLFRKLDLQLGYSSLYLFCRDELGYNKDEAYLRLRAVEALSAVPAMETHLREGRICATELMQAQIAFNGENKRRRAAHSAPLTKKEKAFVLNEIVESRKVSAKKILAERFPEPSKKRDRIRPIGNGLNVIEITVTDEELRDLERLRELLAHKNFAGEWKALFMELVQIGLNKLAPERKTASRPSTAPVEEQLDLDETFVSERKYISVHVKRELHEKAEYQCQYVDPESGRRCTSRHGLQIDHIQPLSLGGSNDITNLRILCGPHNRYEAWRAGVGPRVWNSPPESSP